MKFNNTPNSPVIVEGQEVWISRSVTVLPVIIFRIGDRAYVPLGLRGKGLPDEVGKWGLPGGYLDYDETAGDAVRRECWEELGLNISQLHQHYQYEGTLEQPYSVFSEPIRRQNVTLRFWLIFRAEQDIDLPPLNPQVGKEEVEEARWVELNEALSMDLAFGHHLIIKEFLEEVYTGNLLG